MGTTKIGHRYLKILAVMQEDFRGQHHSISMFVGAAEPATIPRLIRSEPFLVHVHERVHGAGRNLEGEDAK